MAVGPAVTKGTLSSEAQLHAQRMRQLVFDVKNFQAKVVKLQHSGLVAAGYDDTNGTWPPNLGGDGTKDEADFFAYLADVMGTGADVLSGNATQAEKFNFLDALAALL